MTEIQNIKYHTKGEIPKGEHDILRVKDVENSNEILENFKKSITAILKNANLDEEDEKWKRLLPKKIIDIVSQFDDDDFKNDELLFSLPSIVYAVKSPNLKEWIWYSSRLTEGGFEIYFKGVFRARFISFVRFQGVPLSKISIERNGKVYPITVVKDVMTYKSFSR